MPPQLALFLCSVFIAYLFRRDYLYEEKVSGAVWIPTIWMLILGSRSVATWLDLGSWSSSAVTQLEDGSPVDMVVYFGLIVAAVVVLSRRRVSLEVLVENNGLLAVL